MSRLAISLLLVICPVYASYGQNYVSMQDKQGRSFQVKVDPAPGGAHRILNPSVHLSDHGIDHRHLNPQAIDRVTHQLLDDFSPILKLDARQVQLQRAYTDGTMWFVSYRQIHQSVPVEWTKIGYSISPHGEVITLGGRSYPYVEVVTVPTLSSAAALSTAKEVFNEGLAEVRDNAELMILPVGTEDVRFHLTWKVGLFSSRPLRYETYYVDAHSGDVVHTASNLRESHAHEDSSSTDRDEETDPPTLRNVPLLQGTNTANYVPLPFTLEGTITGDYNDGGTANSPFSTTNIKLYNVAAQAAIAHAGADGEYSIGGLTPGLYELRIPLESNWVKLYDADDEVYFRYQRMLTGTTQINHNWSGDISDVVADASNVRYHAHAAHDYFAAPPLGFDMAFQMGASVNQGPSINGQADGQNIFFGSDDDQEWAMASDVIYHEYAHNVIAAAYGGFIGGDYFSQAAAMDEGLADYFAGSITGDSYIGESVGLTRNLDNTFKWSPTQGAHWNGQVIGGAVWDVLGGTDAETANHLALKALQIVPPASDFGEFGENMILADEQYNNGDNVDLIKRVFSDREIVVDDPTVVNPPAPGDGLSIVGPDSLLSFEVGTWTATTLETKTTSYTYRWEYMLLCDTNDPDRGRRVVRCGTWAFGSSDNSYSRMANSTFDFMLKLTVTDALSNLETAEKIVRTVDLTGANIEGHNYGVGLGQQQKQQAEHQVLSDNYVLEGDYPNVLEGNYPNPFNPSTEIRFSLSKASTASLVVYDMTGRVVAELLDGSLGAGSHSVTWNASNLPSGVYVYRLQTGDFVERKLMTLLK